MEGKKSLSPGISNTFCHLCRDVIESIRGISQKFKSFAYFLRKYPEWKGKVVLCHEAFDNESMAEHEKYKETGEEIEKLVGSLNGEFGTVEYAPINYLRQPLNHTDSIALFAIADVALITPLRYFFLLMYSLIYLEMV